MHVVFTPYHGALDCDYSYEVSQETVDTCTVLLDSARVWDAGTDPPPKFAHAHHAYYYATHNCITYAYESLLHKCC